MSVPSQADPKAAAAVKPGLSRTVFAIICSLSVATAMGNTGLISVLPAIGRSIGIPDPMVAAIFSLSAIAWAAMSPFWAQLSDKKGRKPLMMIGITGFVVSMAISGVVVAAGLRHLAPPMVIFGLFLVARALFGVFGSASNPAAQAYVAERTAPENRTQAIANLAGAFGMGTVLGPFIAPLFILPVLGLAGPLFGFALIAAVILVVLWRYLPEPRRGEQKASAAASAVAAKPAVKAATLWRDPRVAPFLIYGFVTGACQTAQAQTLGFLIIDKLGMTPVQAQSLIAVAMMFGAVAALLAQWGLIRMFQMTPRSLLRWGAGLLAVGNIIVAFAPNYSAVVVGFALSSLGAGLARPGFTAGSSIAVGNADQARVAGAVAAVNGISIVFAPAFIMVYERHHAAPFLLNVVLLAGMLVFAFASPALRRAAAQPATREDTVMATLEQADEGNI
ncbi:MFS transporter [Phenylobacterium immobile]|uniref:MFS transporter n=1 Tax=Phenylobacterium immobile TaxID=21 RepID=UPI000AC96442|nr:MFS transporter [Phenylobacterium immobile]